MTGINNGLLAEGSKSDFQSSNESPRCTNQIGEKACSHEQLDITHCFTHTHTVPTKHSQGLNYYHTQAQYCFEMAV